jgi:hypothetical protein
LPIGIARSQQSVLFQFVGKMPNYDHQDGTGMRRVQSPKRGAIKVRTIGFRANRRLNERNAAVTGGKVQPSESLSSDDERNVAWKKQYDRHSHLGCNLRDTLPEARLEVESDGRRQFVAVNHVDSELGDDFGR